MNYIIRTIYIEENNKEYSIFIGKNATGNDDIVKISHPNSIWIHFFKISSPHLIIQNENDIIPKRYIRKVAEMLFEYKKNVPKNIKIIYTKVKNIKCTNIPGSVITTNIEIIKV